ncbi:hypothetical protein NDU88_003656 [Pleurodeles waltl]|uniref:Uncharacterized protein n=1 Tax=Pleurodeles waltl TaxID=8319 RepID=A0AAV7T5Q1_PLEWA|nr:hypothetical protein NDU88_003656 [Pleurodeles waltl]
MGRAQDGRDSNQHWASCCLTEKMMQHYWHEVQSGDAKVEGVDDANMAAEEPIPIDSTTSPHCDMMPMSPEPATKEDNDDVPLPPSPIPQLTASQDQRRRHRKECDAVEDDGNIQGKILTEGCTSEYGGNRHINGATWLPRISRVRSTCAWAEYVLGQGGRT